MRASRTAVRLLLGATLIVTVMVLGSGAAEAHGAISFRLESVVDPDASFSPYAWMGDGGAIDGKTNPKLTSHVGHTLTFEITKADAPGITHNLLVRSPSGQKEYRSENIAAGGERATLEVLLEEDGSYTYLCEYHASSMVGSIEVALPEDPTEDTGPANARPVANFSFTPAEPTTADVVAFDAAASFDPDGTILGVAWDFDDGATEQGPFKPQHRFTQRGTYDVTLTVEDNAGATDTITHQVVVANAPPIAEISFTPEEPRVGETVAFTDLSADGDGSIVSRSWDLGDGTLSDVAELTHAYHAVGTYTVSLTVVDDLGAEATATRQIMVTPSTDEGGDPSPQPPDEEAPSVTNLAPTASFLVDPMTVAPGERVQFTDNSSDPDGEIVAWSWDLGDGNTSAEPSPAHAYADPGGYTVRLTVTDDQGRTHQTAAFIRVVDPAAPVEAEDRAPGDEATTAQPAAASDAPAAFSEEERDAPLARLGQSADEGEDETPLGIVAPLIAIAAAAGFHRRSGRPK